MRMRHANGTATTANTKISVNRGIAQYISITNLDAANNLQVSFNNGVTFYTINSGDPPLQLNALFHWIIVKSNVTATYAALIGEG